MSTGIVAYSARADATPDGELAALGTVYGFVLSRHAKREAAGSSGEEAARAEDSDASQEGMAVAKEAKV